MLFIRIFSSWLDSGFIACSRCHQWKVKCNRALIQSRFCKACSMRKELCQLSTFSPKQKIVNDQHVFKEECILKFNISNDNEDADSQSHEITQSLTTLIKNNVKQSFKVTTTHYHNKSSVTLSVFVDDALASLLEPYVRSNSYLFSSSAAASNVTLQQQDNFFCWDKLSISQMHVSSNSYDSAECFINDSLEVVLIVDSTSSAFFSSKSYLSR